jgi:hypothetical protein
MTDRSNKENLIPDPLIYDDVSLTGVDKIHAVIGGFHLTGGMYEDIIECMKNCGRQIQPILYHVIALAGRQPIELLKLCLKCTYNYCR